MSKRKQIEGDNYDDAPVEEKRARLEKQGIDIIGIEDIVSRFLPIGVGLALQLSVEQIFDLCSVSKTFAAFCHENLGVRFWKSVLLGDFLYHASGSDDYLKCIEDGTEHPDDKDFKKYLDKYGTDVITRYKRAYPYFCLRGINGRVFRAILSVSKIQTWVLKDGKRVPELGPNDWEYWDKRDLNTWESLDVIDTENAFKVEAWSNLRYGTAYWDFPAAYYTGPFAIAKKIPENTGKEKIITGDARMIVFRPKEGVRGTMIRKEDCEVLWSRETRIDQQIDDSMTDFPITSYLPWNVFIKDERLERLELRVRSGLVRGLPIYNKDWKLTSFFKKDWRRTAIYNSPDYKIEASIPDVLSENPIFRIADSTGTLTRFALAESGCGSVRPFDTENGEPLCDHHFDKKLYLDWLNGPVGTKSSGLCPICKN